MSSIANSAGVSNVDKAALEQTYIDLLERRIAQLEACVIRAESKFSKLDSGVDPGARTKLGDGEADGAATETKNVENSKTNDKTEGENSATGGKSNGGLKDAEDAGRIKSDGAVKDNEEKPDSEPSPRVQHFVWKYIEAKEEWGDVEHSKSKNSTDDDKTKPTTIFRDVLHEDNPKKVDFYEIEISSPELKRLFRATSPAQVQLDDGQDPDEGSRIITSPFTDFMWYWDRFEEAVKPIAGDSREKVAAREDLKQLMALTRQSELEPFFKARDAANARGIMPFAYLWTLFPPGTKVYAKTFMDELQMLEVVSCSLPESGDGSYGRRRGIVVDCIGFDWDGLQFNGFECSFELPTAKKEREIAITSLPVYPTTYFRTSDGERNDAKIRERLQDRGKKFWALCGQNDGKFQYKYSGALHVETTSTSRVSRYRTRDHDDMSSAFSSIDENSSTGPVRREYKGPVIIDAYSFLRAQDSFWGGMPLGAMAVRRIESDYSGQFLKHSPVISWRERCAESQQPDNYYDEFADSDERLMMCPPRVLGYALKGKFWAQFQIQSCGIDTGASDEQKKYFAEQLQLNQDYKDMLLAFVNSHQLSAGSNISSVEGAKASPAQSLDVIEGKGKGLVILLHGPPGVGKTLTAETIALATGRPLLTVAVAEIGTEASLAEEKLSVIFDMAARWGAILLMDEADVFLEERRVADDPERNMLVSVLLRCLEYYEGIMFLTTNRITSIDIAVQSRIHLAIQYKSLNGEQAYRIYRNLLDKVPDSGIKGERRKLYRSIEKDLCRRNVMNGRQIRNIVSAALGVARNRDIDDESDNYGKGRLEYGDLRGVYETTTDFLESLKDATEKRRKLNEALDP